MCYLFDFNHSSVMSRRGGGGVYFTGLGAEVVWAARAL